MQMFEYTHPHTHPHTHPYTHPHTHLDILNVHSPTGTIAHKHTLTPYTTPIIRVPIIH